MPKQSTSKGSTVQVRVSDPMKKALDQYAEARGMSVGEFVRYCVWTYMDSTPTDEADEIEADEAARHPETSSARSVELGEVRLG